MSFINIMKYMGTFLANNKYTICLILSLFLYTTDAYAVFEALTGAGTKIFEGLKKIIPAAATIGIACVCIGGMFGNFNWKWLAAILIGVFVITIATATSGVDMFNGMDGAD